MKFDAEWCPVLQACSGEGFHAAVLCGPEAKPGPGGACSSLLDHQGVLPAHPAAHLRMSTEQHQLAKFALEQQARPMFGALLPACAHKYGGLLKGQLVVLQKGGLASTVISFAQKTYANGVLTSKLHVIELGAQAGICKGMHPDNHSEAAKSNVQMLVPSRTAASACPTPAAYQLNPRPSWQLQHCSCPQPALAAPWHLLSRPLCQRCVLPASCFWYALLHTLPQALPSALQASRRSSARQSFFSPRSLQMTSQ